MIREKVRNLWIVESKRTKFIRFLRIVALLGTLWLISFPYTSDEVFTSENALNGGYLSSLMKRSHKIRPIFDDLKSRVDPLETPAELKSFLHDYLGARAETHIQPLESITGGSNIYSFLRTKDGPGLECNAIAAPVTQKPGLVYILTFFTLVSQLEPNWQSKDLMFLFYDESDYSFAVQEFLDTYYAQDSFGP
jgi:hypothetical protein